MPYSFNFSRKKNYDAEPGDVIDSDINWPNSTQIYDSNYKATSFHIKFNDFISSPTSSARAYYLNFNVQVNGGNWESLLDSPMAVTLPKLTDEDSFEVWGDIENSDLAIRIGKYGIDDFQVRNDGGVGPGAGDWKVRGEDGGSGTITFYLDYAGGGSGGDSGDSGDDDWGDDSGDYISTATPPTTVTATPSIAAPNSNVTISWSGQTNEDDIDTYDILIINKDNQSTWWYSDKFSDKLRPPMTSAVLQFDQTGEYHCQVYINTDGDYQKTEESSSTTVTIANIVPPGKPTSLKVNNQSDKTIYIGTIGSPSISFSWQPPTEIDSLNPIASYTLYKGKEPIKENQTTTSLSNFYSAKTEAAQKTGNYTVKAFGQKGGMSQASDGVTIALISDPGEIVFKKALPSFTSDDITLTWDKIVVPTGSTLKYKIDYTIKNGSTTTLTSSLSGDSTEYTFPISKVNINQEFSLTVTAIATANHGGTRETSCSTEYITRIAVTDFSEPWKKLTNELKKENFPKFTYNEITLEWNALDSSSTYIIKYNLDDGSWGDLFKNPINKTSYTITNLSDMSSEGQKIGFCIYATDSYGQVKESSRKYITRMSAPQIPSSYINAISATGFTYNYSYNFKVPEEKLIYEYYLGYNNVFEETPVGIPTDGSNYWTDAADNITGKISNLKEILNSGKNTNASSVRKALYNDVINNKKSKVNGQFKIKLYSETLPTCYTEDIIDFQYNFVTLPIEDIYLEVGNSDVPYYNEGEKISINFNKINWKDAAGGTTGATVVYTIKGNNQTWTKQGNNSSFKIEDTILPSSKDYSLTYSVYAEIKYADQTITSNTVKGSVEVARWTNEDEVYLSSVERKQNKIEGKIKLPYELCSSLKHGNLNKNTGKFFLYYGDGTLIPLTTASDGSQKITLQQYENREIDFNFTPAETNVGDISLYAIVMFNHIKTTIASIQKTTPIYLLRSSGVPVAIRKGRVGINVESNTFIDNSDTTKNSAFYITNGSHASTETPIMELDANDNTVIPKFIRFLKGGSSLAEFYYENSYLRCDKLYYPITKVNGKTGGEIVLKASDVKARPVTWMPSASDVKARPNTWMPTPGDGIDITGETISNTGIRSLSVTSGDSNGQIKVTINGSATNVKVKNLGARAYDSTEYLPLAGGTLTGELTGTKITLSDSLNANSATITGAVSAKVYGGNGIIYTDDGTIPTGTTKGQIWLKKKGT